MIMKVKKLKFKKEIVANLSDAESKQIKGGTGACSCSGCTATGGVWCSDSCLGCPNDSLYNCDSYWDCTYSQPWTACHC